MAVFRYVAPFYDRLTGISGVAVPQLIAEKYDPQPGEEILDVGGGTGTVAQALVRRGARVTILDATPAMLAVAAKKGFPVTLLSGDASDLPFADHSFDGVVCTDALHHFPRPEASLAEMVRVLRPGGRLLIQEFDPTRWGGKVVYWGEWILRQHPRFLPPQLLEAILRGMGIGGSIERAPVFQYIFIGKKEG